MRLALGGLLMLGGLLASGPDPAWADSDEAAGGHLFACRRGFDSFGALARSPATLDLANGLAFIGAGAGISLGGSPEERWLSENGFDSGVRNALRLDGRSSREATDRWSDVLLAMNVAVLPTIAIGVQQVRTGDCVESWDMATDAVESFGLTLFVTEAIKLATGRERPYGKECDVDPPRDANCGSRDRYRSFISGHASLAAAGAGLGCAYSIQRDAWGTSAAARATPCALGIAAAVATGFLRVSADRHWASDVLVSFGVGAAIGWFDTWGPFDLLRFETRDAGGDVALRGLVLPEAGPGRVGARLHVVF